MKLVLAFILTLPIVAQPRFNGFPLLPAVTDNSTTTCSSTNLPSASSNSGGFSYVINTAATVVVMCRSNGTNWIQASSSGGAVSSVFTRTGAVVAAGGDYTAAQVTNAVDKTAANTYSGGFLQNLSSDDLQLPNHASDPGTCAVGQIEVNTTSAVSKVCLATNTWTTLATGANVSWQIGGASVGASGTANLVPSTGVNVVGSFPGSVATYTFTADTNVMATRACLEASCSTGLSFTRASSATYTATGAPTFTTYTINQTLTFVFPHNCDGADTVNIDGLGPIPLQKLVSGSLVAVAINDCVNGVPFLALAVGSPVTAYRIYP
jgi:hypothetical protein